MVRVLAVGLLAWLLAGPLPGAGSAPLEIDPPAAFTTGSLGGGCAKVLAPGCCNGEDLRCDAACAQSGSCAVAAAPRLSFFPQQNLSSMPAPRFVDEPQAPDARPPKRRSA